MLPTATHVTIDGETHRIHKFVEHPTGPRHTHRVHLHCGMTIDVDMGGVRHSAAAQELRELADAKLKAPQGDVLGHAPLHLAKADELELIAAERRMDFSANGSRWKVGAQDSCAKCVQHRREPHVLPLGHNPPRTRPADIGTGLSCEICGSQLYIRHSNGTVACTAQGHEFTITEALATSMKLLHRLATGKLEK